MNKVEMLLNDEGEWVSNSADPKNMVVAYYKELFGFDRMAGGSLLLGTSCWWMRIRGWTW